MINDLTEVFENVKYLKTGFGLPVTTKNALRFIRSRQAYKALKDGVNQRLESEGAGLDYTLGEVSNLCDVVRVSIRTALDMASFDSWKKDRNPEINNKFFDIERYYPTLYLSMCEKDGEKFDVDYEAFVCGYARSFSQDRNPREAFRDTFLEFYGGNSIHLIKPDGERITYSQFEEDKSLHLTSELWEGEIGPRDEEFYTLWFEDLQDWIKFGATDYFEVESRLEDTTEEEKLCLYGIGSLDDKSEPYNRAVEEKTLKRMETERQVALAYILNNNYGNIRDSISGIERNLVENRGNHEKLKSVTSHGEIMEWSERLIKRNVYIRNAIKKNTRWLEGILS
jgi:hypothetical protein